MDPPLVGFADDISLWLKRSKGLFIRAKRVVYHLNRDHAILLEFLSHSKLRMKQASPTYSGSSSVVRKYEVDK